MKTQDIIYTASLVIGVLFTFLLVCTLFLLNGLLFNISAYPTMDYSNEMNSLITEGSIYFAISLVSSITFFKNK